MCARVLTCVRTLGDGGFCREKAGCGAVCMRPRQGVFLRGEDRPWAECVCVHVCLWAGGVSVERGRAMSSVCVCVCPTAERFLWGEGLWAVCVCVPTGGGFLWGEGEVTPLLPGQQGQGGGSTLI